METVMSAMMPFHTYLWKIASRCNINCSYCYIYNSADTRWLLQPKLMSEKVAIRTATRIREHLERHNKHDAAIVFHGGEPMLGGIAHLRRMAEIIGWAFHGANVKLQVGIQTNLLLFTPEIGDFFLKMGIVIGTSLDGPPAVNDIHRRDHQGRPTSQILEEKLTLLCSAEYRPLFSGFLCVINPDTDPEDVTRYLLTYTPPNVDFLFPLNNHDRPPMGKAGEHRGATPYADWLIRAFDYWIAHPNSTSIRIFNSIIRMICGAPSLVESLGTGPVDLVVVETNGEIEAVDSLKSTFEGATSLGYNVFDHAFDTVALDTRVRSRQRGAASLSSKCQKCAVLHACGGGYVPHRYSSDHGFDNPSVYCADLEKLIRHIHTSLGRELDILKAA